MKKGDKIVLVCGGRHYKDTNCIDEVLSTIQKKLDGIDLIITGGQKTLNITPKGREYIGADYLAGQWAKKNKVPLSEFKAKWKTYGRSAGPIRNRQMLNEGKPNLVVAFPGGRGTANMIDLADRAGVSVLKVEQ